MIPILKRIFRPWAVIAELEKETQSIVDWRANYHKKCHDLDDCIARADREEAKYKDAERRVELAYKANDDLDAKLDEAKQLTRDLRAERDRMAAEINSLRSRLSEDAGKIIRRENEQKRAEETLKEAIRRHEETEKDLRDALARNSNAVDQLIGPREFPTQGRTISPAELEAAIAGCNNACVSSDPDSTPPQWIARWNEVV